eukprot:7117291-Lingulodinium_polyedra.AAC.1
MPQGLVDSAANRIRSLAQQHTDATVIPAARLWDAFLPFRLRNSSGYMNSWRHGDAQDDPDASDKIAWVWHDYLSDV